MIAVDVMGGDRAPEVTLEGGLAAARTSVPVAFYGPGHRIEQWLHDHDRNWQSYAISIVDAPEVIDMAAEPVAAVRRYPHSSLVQAVISVATGKSVAVVSAGNSGAVMTAAVLFVGRHKDVERPAISVFLPTLQVPVLALDVGANTECRPRHLCTFAHLGVEYLEQIMGMVRPRVGLLSNGHEPGKGNSVGKEAFNLLTADSLNFIGNVEPYDVFAGSTDVVVCDGFAGNVLLKTMEAVGAMLTSKTPGIPDICTPRGGALLLGVNGTVLICHGNVSALGIEQAIVQAWNISRRNNNTDRNDKYVQNTHKSVY